MRSTKALLLGIAIGAVAVGATTAVYADGGSTITACANKSTGAMRYISKGSCKKTERKVTWSSAVQQPAQSTGGVNLYVVDATGQELGVLVATNANDGYSFIKDGGIWTAHPGVLDYPALLTNYYQDQFCSQPIGIIKYQSDKTVSTILGSDRYITNRGNVITGYKPSGTPFRGQSVSSVFQWSTNQSRCVLTYTSGSLATTLFVPLAATPAPTYVAPLTIVSK